MSEVKEIKLKQADESFVEAKVEFKDGVLFVSPKVEKFEPKDGDVVATERGGNLFVCKMRTHKNGIYAHIGFNLITGGIFKEGEYVAERLATEGEKRLLFSKLAEKGWKFDFEKKELIKLKWKPILEEPYFSPSFSDMDFLFKTSQHIYTGHFTDEMTIQKNRAFKTKEECQLFCDKLNQTIEEYEP